MSKSVAATAKAQAVVASAGSAAGTGTSQPSGKYYMCEADGVWHLVGFTAEQSQHWATALPPVSWLPPCGMAIRGTLVIKGPITCVGCLEHMYNSNKGIAERWRG